VADVVNDHDASSWRDSAREELLQLIDDMLHTEKTHIAAGERLGRIHRRLGLLATLLATLGGATVLSDQSNLAAGLFALGAAVASGVLTFMKPDKAAEQHLSAGRQLGALRVRARQTLNLDLDRLTPDEVRVAIKAVADDKASIDASAPGTEIHDYEVARKKIVLGTFDRDR
jgi:hypothetical protein